MSKLSLILLCVIVLLCGTSSYFYYKYDDSKKDCNRLKLNEKVYSNGISFYKTKFNNQVAVTSDLKRTVDEFKNDKSNERLLNKIKELNLKIKNIQSTTTIGQKIDTVIKDSIVYVDNCMKLDNKYIFVKLCKDSSIIKLNDTIDIIEDNHRIEYINKRSKIFFIRWFQDKQRVIDLSVTHTNKLIETNNIKKQIIVK